jgi:RNA polymerase sigma factor (sigma-70 family)
MSDDADLIRRYACARDEDAFAELVRRHLGLVYQAALRQVGGDAHLAQDVAQRVFADLARKADRLQGRAVLAGWLYTSTRFAAAQAVRAERRRRAREEEAQRMNDLMSSAESSAHWERLRPVIDDALHALGERDREALLLRFFEGRAFADLGEKLAVSEDAARMRVERALGKLRGLLERRGVTSAAAALAVTLANPALAAAPAGLAAPIAGTALAGMSAVGSASALITFMGVTKLQLGLAGALVVGGTAGFWMQEKTNEALRAESARLVAENAMHDALQQENRELKRVAIEVRELRKDDLELARLQSEAMTLKAKIEAAAAAKARLQRQVAQRADGRNVLSLSEVDQLPKLTSRGTPPAFPAALRKAGIGGEATVQFVIGPDGQMKDAEVVNSTHEAFAQAALESVRTWKYDAAKKGNLPVDVRVTVPMVFTLNAEDGDERGWF